MSGSTSWRERLPELSLPRAVDPGGPLVVVSAHPDDEVIALGAWLCGQTDRDVLFVTATDGESSHPGSPTVTPDDLRRLRPPELVAALTLLGHVGPRVERLRLRDADLPADAAALAAALEPLLAHASLVVAPFHEDGHADHDVVGAVVRAVAPATATVWHYPVWLWEWTEPGAVPWLDRAATLSASVDDDGVARARKAAALQAFV
ncbi:MAG: PIG-L family deacetylase, partial [Actinomycetales bacterium]